jgi:hypothetical protein
MILYLPAKVDPLIKVFTGVWRVLVREGEIPLNAGSCVPQSPQKLCVSGLSLWHLGHLTAIFTPSCSDDK